MTQHDHAPCRVRTRSRGPGGERADLAVAQAVEDQGEQSAGRGDDADVAAAGGDDPGTVGGELAPDADVLAGLNRGPAHQFRALFICGTTVVKPRGPCAQIFFWIFFGGRGAR
jgi:hypothetical protein